MNRHYATFGMPRIPFDFEDLMTPPPVHTIEFYFLRIRMDRVGT